MFYLRRLKMTCHSYQCVSVSKLLLPNHIKVYQFNSYSGGQGCEVADHASHGPQLPPHVRPGVHVLPISGRSLLRALLRPAAHLFRSQPPAVAAAAAPAATAASPERLPLRTLLLPGTGRSTAASLAFQ